MNAHDAYIFLSPSTSSNMPFAFLSLGRRDNELMQILITVLLV